MKIQNLELNIKYKSYRAICTTLEEEIKTGNAKIAQLKDWSRYFRYHKEGNGFIVDEIYGIPKEKVDNRKGHSGKSEGSRNNYIGIYGKYIDILLENKLYNIIQKRQIKEDNIVYITNVCIAELVKMVNFNYRTCNANREKFHRYLYKKNLSSSLAEQDIFTCIYAHIRPAIISSLTRLEKSNKIVVQASYIFYLNDYKQRCATDKETKYIKEVEKEQMQVMEITNAQKMWNINIRKKFYEKVQKIVLDHFAEVDSEINGYYQGYKITVENCNAQENIKALEKEFNTLFAANVMDSISKKIEKLKDDWGGIVLFKNEWDRKRIGLKYGKSIERLIKILISYNTLNITDIISNIKTQKQIDQENIELAKDFDFLFKEVE
ncbi:phage-like protein [Clostridium pasteurianum DSM 525 = ATCC 6013]|uniref:Phage-like protein n=1 Tax=Clostridium pasteurianum DSM 525 = ATCC 6013 TaxID=1262449 RepID=A0A0H3J3Z8_CLOPA|nr:hypothetical protein [Clostridium pasteurianum]AJA48651.1 phage-like protein [Clostridium pasteurianum DSM 525 = ATCC 6013]AJA52639.1 phage-like protein [Clostridium pasteurianum DSM 525 = ATCC 6013]AOZ75880.1 hypothetical protein AQ983_12550 [Clostridium pasteurianum DSM 525 = ATCC 6013]AOZ79676.1 hypothetical protein AQ984_12545 [Clostridium pasteurianum]ELP59950.1 phage-like protein [Clostridium pasteurianum DSM 525 = ATCC 6013]